MAMTQTERNERARQSRIARQERERQEKLALMLRICVEKYGPGTAYHAEQERIAAMATPYVPDPYEERAIRTYIAECEAVGRQPYLD